MTNLSTKETIITQPMCKIDKVKHLLNIADKLNILNDKMFDQLMDKYENTQFLFDVMLEAMNSCIFEKVPIETTKELFKGYLSADTFESFWSSTILKKYCD